PHIDQLASDGIRFTDAHTAASVCTPSRFAILTGCYAWRSRLKLGVLDFGDPALIDAARLTWPKMLQQQGYATAAFGKWHLGWDWATKDGLPVVQNSRTWSNTIDFTRPINNGPITRGFDYFFGMVGATPTGDSLIENDQPIFQGIGKCPPIAGAAPGRLNPWHDYNSFPLLTDKVVWYIDRHAKQHPDQPMFIYYAITAPHMPIIPSPEFKGKTKHGDACDYIAEIDSEVGRVLKALKQNGMEENTLVLFSSDNGSPCYADGQSPTFSIKKRYGHDPSRPWRGGKGDAWEGGHRVPLVARWPAKIKPGQTSDETICLVDLMTTSAAILGAKLPNSAAEDSYNMLPAFLGEPRTKPIREATVHHSLIGTFAIRQGPWKLIDHLGSGGFSVEQYEPPKAGQPIGQLYNLTDDPGETKNLYNERPEVVARLSALLKKYQRDGRSAPQ
ncbi:MAG: arylsulfatase, partial [Planctomycetia bacterium]|nr:arylsulfatase [Planctomycetia bacterium]